MADCAASELWTLRMCLRQSRQRRVPSGQSEFYPFFTPLSEPSRYPHSPETMKERNRCKMP